MADVQGLLDDPRFASLSSADQKKALAGIDQRFAQLSDADLDKFKKSVKPKPSFLQQNINAAKATGQDIVGAAKSYGNAALNIGQGALDVMTLGADRLVPGAKETKAKISKAMEPTSEQMLGYGAGEASQYFIPIPGLEQVKAAEGAGKLAKAGYTALREGAKLGATRFAQTGDPKEGAEAGAAGAIFGALSVPAADRLRAWSRSIYKSVLRPSSAYTRKVTEETLLGGGGQGSAKDIVGRGLVGTSAKSLEKQASDKTIDLAKQLNETYAKLGDNVKLKLAPIYADVYEYIAKEGLFKDGTVKDPKVLVAGLRTLKELSERLGPELAEASPERLRDFRHVLEKSLYKTDIATGVSKQLAVGPKDEITKATANGIRRVLNSQPDINALNREYHFWETAREVLHARNAPDARTGTVVAIHIGRSLTGAALGEEYGRRSGGFQGAIIGGAAGAVIGETGGAALAAAFRSPAFRSVAAVTLDRIADKLSEREVEEAGSIAANAVAQLAKTPEEKAKLAQLGKQAIEARAKKVEYVKKVNAKVESSPKVAALVKNEIAKNPAAELTAKWTPSSQAPKVVKSGDITPEEQKAASIYKGPGYLSINKYLYNPRHELNPVVLEAVKKQVAGLDSLIAKHTLDSDAILYRGQHGAPAAKLLQVFKPGEVMQPKNFQSTSSSIAVSANGFANKEGVLFKINAPKGTNAYPYGDSGEKEYLLPRNTKYKVKKITKDTGQIPVIEVDVIK